MSLLAATNKKNDTHKTIHASRSKAKARLVLGDTKGSGMDQGGNRVLLADNLEALRKMASGSVDLIYIDPPFNTGREQKRPQIKTIRDEAGDRVGFGGRRYRTERVTGEGGGAGYGDR